MTYTEAMMGPDSEKWFGAMEYEIQCMHDNQVWNLVDPIDGVRLVGCKRGFKKKREKEENVHIYKHNWWQKVLRRFMVLSMMKLSHSLRCKSLFRFF
jgi:DNA-binding MltR family transcriptional regulator